MKDFLIIKNGNINFNNMVKNNVEIDKLFLFLRKKKVNNIENIDYLFYISNKIIFYKEKFNPVSLIINGRILYFNLFKLGKTKKWLIKILNKRNVIINNINYALVLNDKLYIVVDDN